ncbi:bis(5'-nucleosyl)-tetraphosphatase (symmetrical) YqeK [Paenibacillus sp. J2TS4]|uniref:bis(5'-nucleosyl)-tetraphosphatase (symmetrical) YqeK n=1 Tax=Paenibacillus sp. J2TS4 TaxID=2807194 RepID=UPI001B1804C4|nr:bis(5'-nucleosyl)-tetraphosphatase (symmetrical) YqeK [Paenibacillus sp. J2TS4]GIP35887.1 HD domain-containing protein [Paenibacillus sp. J2TS4]
MNRDQLISLVKEQMPLKRWEHTAGVMKTAVQLAERYGADPVQADLAALLHDYCKYWPIERQRKIIEDNEKELSPDLLLYDKPLWHAPAGAWVAERQLGITDSAVLDAIRYHTSGRPGMTLLDKVVCLADYIEPGRDFPEVNKIRELAEHSLEIALIAGFDSTISFLLQKGQKVYPLTIMARNSLIDEISRKVDG